MLLCKHQVQKLLNICFNPKGVQGWGCGSSDRVPEQAQAQVVSSNHNTAKKRKEDIDYGVKFPLYQRN
jgi:hypothetical protein